MSSVTTNEGWVCLHDYDGDFVIFDKGRIVAVTDSDTEWDARNANRIAAAPELYELLKFFVNSESVIVPAVATHFGENIVDICSCGGCVLQRRYRDAKAAVAKAEGRA